MAYRVRARTGESRVDAWACDLLLIAVAPGAPIPQFASYRGDL